MLQWRNNSAAANAIAQAAAIGKSQAVIEFNLDGTIITANQNFLDALGYRLDEIQGKHHSMFVEPGERDSAEYRAFWANLNRGEYQAAEYKRLAKGGREIWIQASYNPIFDRSGKPCRVVKFATDITAQKIRSMEDAGKLAAISRAQAVIEFNLDGTIITANENFLAAVGYSLAEIQGKHHSMFVSPAERDSAAYREFWASLSRGEFQSAEYKRYRQGRQGDLDSGVLQSDPRRCWQAVQGGEIRFRRQRAEIEGRRFPGQVEAIGKSQAVIEFNMDGTIITANENFLGAVGYRLDEIQGKHHSHVRGRRPSRGDAYREFWASLNRGEFQSAEYKRVGKGGREIWIQASYNPILRSQRQALQGGEIRHRHHGPGDRPHEERKRPRHDGIGRGRRRAAQHLGSRNFRGDGEIQGHRDARGGTGRSRRSSGAAVK